MTRLIKSLRYWLLVIGYFILFPSSGYAVNIEDAFPPARNFKDIGSLVNVLVPNFMILAGILIFIGVLAGGFMMIRGAGSGDAHASENAKNAITALIIGMLLIFGAYWIVQIIEFVMGVTILPI